MNTLISQFQTMNTIKQLNTISSLKDFIKNYLKENGIKQGSVAKKVGVSERNISDWLGKNETMDVLNLAKICEACNYNFFQHVFYVKSDNNSKQKKAKVSVLIEVENEYMERQVLETVLDKFTAKKLIG
ncbi:MAG: helix-turn-helix transcriptional regulator [Bacteroidetes bacterium]|nr:helix-turn-helix transcriptional regulator [Bacteroidota bacterium]